MLPLGDTLLRDITDKPGVLKVYNADALKITPTFKEDFSKFYNALALKIIF